MWGYQNEKESKHEKIWFNHSHPQSGLVGLIFGRCPTNQAGRGPRQHLRIQVICSFTGSQILGPVSSLSCPVDGKDVTSLSEGQNYDGYLPAGQHVISARADPNLNDARPGRKTLTVKAGQTYSYTAAWSGQNLVLVRNH